MIFTGTPIYTLLIVVLMLHTARPETQSITAEEGGIPAIDSDFLFMHILPSILPFPQAGLGVFAKVDIPANEILCEYRGATIPSNITFMSNYIYSSKTIHGEPFNIIPDMDKPICAYINDCVLIVGNSYSAEELDAYESNESIDMPTYAGYEHNAAPMYTIMGKVFIISKVRIPAGSEIYYPYGSKYWIPRIKYPDSFP
jgi:hypothetical protein